MIKRLLLLMLAALFMLSISFPAFGQEQEELKYLPKAKRAEAMRDWRRQLDKAMQGLDDRYDDRKEVIITGNQIRVLLTNFGSISTPDADNSNADLVWPQGAASLGYAYEFGPMVAAAIPDGSGDTLKIVNDGFISLSDGDFQPGTTTRWGWQPRSGFSAEGNPEMAHFSDIDSDLDGKPDSWPESFYNETLGRYVWPAFLGDDATAPDEEVYYVLDDFSNAEYPYFPFPEDSTRRGLGLEMQIRIFQFNNPLAEDLIFLVYTITNVSPKRLDNVWLGMFGDPHVGGPNDFGDDFGNFISRFNTNFDFKARNMLYAYDEDGRGDGGKSTGYFGYKFLESPGIEYDGLDNDNDGLVDESPFNDAGSQIFGPIGIYGDPVLHWEGDEDGDWDPEFDDVGVDGIAGTGDYGEGDGKPNQLFYQDVNDNSMYDSGEPTSEFRLEGMRFLGGEPNFGFLDIAESDQLGLTSFNALQFGGNNRPKNDELMFDTMSGDNQGPDDPPPSILQDGDNVFIYGSGPFSLEPGESQRFSIALILGENLDDLVQNAVISQDVFEADYRFAKPPTKPKVVAVPGDSKVHLYWDAEAENSFDPFVARANSDDDSAGYDFEGYKIYRSRDYSFNDTKIITDSKGIPFLSKPHEDNSGIPAVFDIRDNGFHGLSEIEYPGRGVRYDLGQNSGLVHMYTDSNNVVNGVTYYYAVTAYDHGDPGGEIPPSETQRTIQRDALTRLFSFDVNTVQVVPGPQATNAIDAHIINSTGNLASRVSGNATGDVRIQILDPLKVVDQKSYDVLFQNTVIDSVERLTYSVIDGTELTREFTGRDTALVSINATNIVPGSETVVNEFGGTLASENYILDDKTGRIRGAQPGDIEAGTRYTITFQRAPVFQSTSFNNEDDNPVFDGMRVFVNEDEVTLSQEKSGWKINENNSNFLYTIGLAGVGRPEAAPLDFEIHFTDYDTTADGTLTNPADTTILGGVVTPFRIIEPVSGKQLDFFINEPSGWRNQRWDWVESIVLIHPDAEQVTETVYQVTFDVPRDTIYSDGGEIEDIIVDAPVYPGEGDVFLFFSSKSFNAESAYRFETRAVEFENATPEDALGNVYVVPNPYIAYGAGEIAAPRTGERDDKRLEFRNLPDECTIRIYTITGELVDTIEKNDASNFAVWNLLSSEAQKIAYGVYIYHVEAPGIGTTTGRFAVIK